MRDLDYQSVECIHIVRRYGLCGGLERYVWEITRRLARLGHRVTVICEFIVDPLPNCNDNGNLRIIQVGRVRPNRPRWLSQLRFADRVNRVLAGFDLERHVVHSHERSACHDVSTIHGPSIRSRKRRISDGLSLRLRVWEYLERQEIGGLGVQAVFPVSHTVAESYVSHYPDCADRFCSPAYPAPSAEFNRNSRTRKRAGSESTIGFIGHEWRRKGLDKLIEAVGLLRARRGNVVLRIGGCTRTEIDHLFNKTANWIEVSEWVDPVRFLAEIDLLVLPARVEPFGMVAAEANACGVPVVVSRACGVARFVGPNQGAVVEGHSAEQIAAACSKVLDQELEVTPMQLSWDRTTGQYLAAYGEVLARKRIPAEESGASPSGFGGQSCVHQ